MGVIKKTICYAVLAMLFISGSTWGGEADEHISQFMEMVSKMEIDQKVEYRFSFHAPGEELSDANEIIAYLDQTPERVMVIAEESIGSVFGKERFQAAEYAIKTDDISDGEEVYLYDGLPFLDVALQMSWGADMYWYDDEASLTIGLHMDRKENDNWCDWNVTLSAAPYEPVSVDLKQLPFETFYNMEECEVRKTFENLPGSYCVVDEGSEMETAVYTVYLPENEDVEYVQLHIRTLDVLQSFAVYAGNNYRMPGDRRLSEVYYYFEPDFETDKVKNWFEEEWQSDEISNYVEGVWEIRTKTKDVRDVTELNSTEMAEIWKAMWLNYETIGFYEKVGGRPVLCYNVWAQLVIPLLEEWHEIVSLESSDISRLLEETASAEIEAFWGSTVELEMVVDGEEHTEILEELKEMFSETGYVKMNEPYDEDGMAYRCKFLDEEGQCLAEVAFFDPKRVAVNGELYLAVDELDYMVFNRMRRDNAQHGLYNRVEPLQSINYTDSSVLKVSPYVVLDDEQTGIELAAAEGSMSYYVVNHTNEVLECSYWRALEVCLDEAWYQLDGEAAWILSSERIEPGSSKLMEDSWVLEYYPVGKGRYRILANMWFGEDEKESFYMAHEFSIE